MFDSKTVRNNTVKCYDWGFLYIDVITVYCLYTDMVSVLKTS